MNRTDTLTAIKESVYLHYLLLLGAVFIFVGKPVPYSNEYSYLLRLRQVYDAGFLANDITFSTTSKEYWLFDHLFGLLTFVFSIETIGWIGRISCWAILLFALMRLAKRWEIPLWVISASILIWLGIGQSIVADEWMFGGFEAKTVAYIFLLFALDRLSLEDDLAGSILLGLSFAFHPIVGLWGIAGAILALLIWHRDIHRVSKVAIVSALLSLIGLVPLLIMRSSSIVPTEDDLRYFQLIRFPHHFDPLSWSKSAIVLIFLALVFCFLVHISTRRLKPLDFLFSFIGVLGLFFALGILLRLAESYELMKYTPTRVFAVFIPLFFLFYLGRALKQNILLQPLLLGALGVIVLLSFWNDLPARAFEAAGTTYQKWIEGPDDMALAFGWIKNNTREGVIILAPPWRYDFWYLSERSQVVSYGKPILTDVGEWRSRMEKLTGTATNEDGIRDSEILADFYFGLDEETIRSASAEYNADYFISKTSYSFPVVYSNSSIKIYDVVSVR